MRFNRDGASSGRVTEETLVLEMEGKASTALESSLSKEKKLVKEECGCVQIGTPSNGSIE